jgi:hypothetical protein
MDARAVDESAVRLRELRHQERSALGLGALALALSLVATSLHPELALPLFIGGIAVGAVGVRALWHRWDIVDSLVGDRDAYVISEIRERAVHETTMERRRVLAATLRSWLTEPMSDRVRAAAEELQAVAAELEDDRLVLEPVCAVACSRLLNDPDRSPLLNPAFPAEDLRAGVLRIRSGFASRSRAADTSHAEPGGEPGIGNAGGGVRWPRA